MRLSTNQKAWEEGMESDRCQGAQVTAHLAAAGLFSAQHVLPVGHSFGQCCLLTCAGVFAGRMRVSTGQTIPETKLTFI